YVAQGSIVLNFDAVTLALIFPIIAALVMTAIESLVETLGWRQRMLKGGWDLCVLAVGSIAGIFGIPKVVDQWGTRAVPLCILATFVALFSGILILHIRKKASDKPTGLQGFISLVLGGAALVLPWYFALHY